MVYVYADIVQSREMWEDYLLNINTSLATYSDCVINCHSLTMTSDLGVWTERDGIKWEEFEQAKDKMYGGVHYQIINHQLYRSKNCMFIKR